LRGLDKSIITCVELFEPSVQVLRGEGFKAVRNVDMRQAVAVAVAELEQWDRVTAFDVIEHIPRAHGEKLLDQIEQIATKEIVIFMPIETPELESTDKWRQYRETGLSFHPTAQRELHDHKSRWAPADLAARGYITLTLPDFHYPGFGAFFAAKYRDPEVQAVVLERLQEFARSQQQARIIQPLFVLGREHMDIDPSVVIAHGSRLECITAYGGVDHQPKLTIGAGTSAEMFLHIGCAERVTIGRDCIIAGHVSITDHDHGYAQDRPLHGQPLTVKPVKIGDSVFIGEYTFVCKGVTIGDHAVIGAHSVVTRDVPAGETWAGVPARPIRRPCPEHQHRWGWTSKPGPTGTWMGYQCSECGELGSVEAAEE